MKSTLLAGLKIGLLSIAIIVSSCSSTKKIPFNDSMVVPGAEGMVKVKKDKNNNYQIDIDVANLAESKKLTPSKNAYVVWIETNEKGTKNIGQIHSSSSLFSKTKKASISTVSPVKPVKVFVTAEDDPNIESPGSQVVLTTTSF